MSTQDKTAPTDEQILAAARAMNKLAAEACGVDEADHWALYGNSQIIDASVILRAALASTQQAEPSLRKQLQRRCSEWGAYWRASDSHGVELTSAQAVELLEEALGVEVEIEQAEPAQAAVPHPGSPEASAMMDSVLAEYNWPTNTKNAARAGYVAAARLMGVSWGVKLEGGE
jgi:hypothetical protein